MLQYVVPQIYQRCIFNDKFDKSFVTVRFDMSWVVVNISSYKRLSSTDIVDVIFPGKMFIKSYAYTRNVLN